MSKKKKILVAVWGNPSGWRDVEYIYEGESTKAKSTLPLIKDVEKPDKIIIICADTLSDNFADGLKNPSYNDLKSVSENFIRNFCIENFGFEPDKIIVGYGFGEFDKTKFSGNAPDFYYGVFKELVFAFVEYLSFEKEDIEIIFDITHGINFMIVLTDKALREILGILAYVLEVDLKVLNSDPFIGRVKVQKLNINIIEKLKVVPGLVAYRHKRPIEPFDKNKIQELGKEIEKLCQEKNYKKNEIHVFLSSFIFGIPVYVLSYLPDYNGLREQIEGFHKKFEEHIKINTSQKIEVPRDLKFYIEFENILKAYLVSFILSKKGFRRLTDIPIDDIKNLKDKIYKKFPIERNRIDKEIDDINKLDNLRQDYKAYTEIKDMNSSHEIDKRNFFAHAGFEYNSIIIKKDHGKIKIKINEELKSTANDLLINALPKL